MARKGRGPRGRMGDTPSRPQGEPTKEPTKAQPREGAQQNGTACAPSKRVT